MRERVISKEEAHLRDTLLSLPWVVEVLDTSPAGRLSSDERIFVTAYGESDGLSYYVGLDIKPDFLAIEGAIDRFIANLETHRKRLLRDNNAEVVG